MINSDICRYFEFCFYSCYMLCVYLLFFKVVFKYLCDDWLCKNGGYCMQVGSIYKCYCRFGYIGLDCSLGKIDFCFFSVSFLSVFEYIVV